MIFILIELGVKMKTQTIIMPAHWASAIANHDYSGLDDIEICELNVYLLGKDLTFKDCLMCSKTESLNDFNGKLTMTLEYTFKA
jgi:hypothetical protein